jgi:hypothetical protein
MKLIINLVSFIVIMIFSFMTLKYLNEILIFHNLKKKNMDNATKIIEENERIQGMNLDSFLSEADIKKQIYTEDATIYIYKIEDYDFVYVDKED